MARIKTAQELLEDFENQAYYMQKVSDKFQNTLDKLVKEIYKLAKNYYKEFGSFTDAEWEAADTKDLDRFEKSINVMDKLSQKIEDVIYDYAYFHENENAVLSGYYEDYENESGEYFPLSYLELQNGIASIETMPVGINARDIVDFAIEVAADRGTWRDLLYEIQEAYH